MSNTKKPIKKLTIKGFKSIQSLLDFELGNLNVLIGANGVGKSNFVSYFKMLGELVEQRLQFWVKDQGSPERILSFGLKETAALSSSIDFGQNTYHFELRPSNDEGLIFFSEDLSYYFYKNNTTSLGSGQKESLLKNSTTNQNKVTDYCYDSITGWKVFHFHDTSDTAGVKRLKSVQDNQYLRSDASNLAAYLYRLRDESPNTYAEIRSHIRLAIPFFDDFVLNPVKQKSEEELINLQWKQINSDYHLWPSQLSDGSIRFICLVAALLQPDPPSTIIIDEPELGLHPYAIQLLGSLLHSASTKMQVIVSTQSVQLLNEFSINDLIVVEREGGASVFKRFKEEDFKIWLDNYSIGELWEKNIFGGRP